ncbi:hypothetical protein CDAR_209601 [Caerostris darwini]|uniref:Uncharacterized protein n=1 Tax=Caerostris darwini TaxID=1538125 RepID=A0AAV4T1W1_9ARAC|nr:hypothetical protein CDAR_209601 [Caerostris darwini]
MGELEEKEIALTAVTSGAGGGESSLSVSDETWPIPGERFRPSIFNSKEDSSFKDSSPNRPLCQKLRSRVILSVSLIWKTNHYYSLFLTAVSQFFSSWFL